MSRKMSFYDSPNDPTWRCTLYHSRPFKKRSTHLGKRYTSKSLRLRYDAYKGINLSRHRITASEQSVMYVKFTGYNEKNLYASRDRLWIRHAFPVGLLLCLFACIHYHGLIVKHVYAPLHCTVSVGLVAKQNFSTVWFFWKALTCAGTRRAG